MRHNLPITLTLFALAAVPAYADRADPQSPAYTESDVSGGIPGVATDTLARGRQVVADLRLALQWAQQQNSQDVRWAINDAHALLESFDTNAARLDLRRQIDLIRQQIASTGKPLPANLWLPIEARLDHAVVGLPTQQIGMARGAVDAGRLAAAANDRKAVAGKLDVLENVLDYRVGILPLAQIRGDVRSAEMSLLVRPPYWGGVIEAMKTALSHLEWVTGVQASGWLVADESALAAQDALAVQEPSRARVELARVAQSLQGMPNASRVAHDANELAKAPQLDPVAVSSLIHALRMSAHHAEWNP
jgi:hypothetical protein